MEKYLEEKQIIVTIKEYSYLHKEVEFLNKKVKELEIRNDTIDTIGKALKQAYDQALFDLDESLHYKIYLEVNAKFKNKKWKES